MTLRNFDEKQKECRSYLLQWKISTIELRKMNDKESINESKRNSLPPKFDRKLKKWEKDEKKKHDSEIWNQSEQKDKRKKSKKKSWFSSKN